MIFARNDTQSPYNSTKYAQIKEKIKIYLQIWIFFCNFVPSIMRAPTRSAIGSHRLIAKRSLKRPMPPLSPPQTLRWFVPGTPEK